jgi:hypothetical protein
MIRRLHSVPSARLTALGTTLLLASSFIAVHVPDRIRLSRDAMSQSRGNSQGSALTHPSCNTLNGNFACGLPNTPCVSCANVSYTGVTGAPNGGYQVSGTGSCGKNYPGTCNASLDCVTGTTAVGTCAAPSAVAQQP